MQVEKVATVLAVDDPTAAVRPRPARLGAEPTVVEPVTLNAPRGG